MKNYNKHFKHINKSVLINIKGGASDKELFLTCDDGVCPPDIILDIGGKGKKKRNGGG